MEEKKYIEISESTNILKLWLRTKDGKETGEHLEFNLKDLELIDRLQKASDETNKNHNWLNNQFAIINKKQDFTKKGRILSNNQQLKYNAIKEFMNRQMETYNLFLGEDGVKKILNGRKVEWETVIEIEDIIKNQIAPQLDITMDNITNEVKEKYKINIDSKEKNVLE